MLLDPVATCQSSSFGLKEDYETRIEDLKALQNNLGLDDFRKLILNFVQGNQLVIKGNDPRIVRSIISILKVSNIIITIAYYINNYAILFI
jgi:hypothetical protein